MTINAILMRKNPGVVTVDILSTLKAAAELMSHHHIAALVVTEKNVPVGLLSERHIVEIFARQGKFAEEIQIQQVIDRDLITVSLNETLTRVMLLMTHTKMRHLPVTKAGEVVGIVSLGDLVKYHLEETRLGSMGK